jgi:hypothetical protein
VACAELVVNGSGNTSTEKEIPNGTNARLTIELACNMAELGELEEQLDRLVKKAKMLRDQPDPQISEGSQKIGGPLLHSGSCAPTPSRCGSRGRLPVSER